MTGFRALGAKRLLRGMNGRAQIAVMAVMLTGGAFLLARATVDMPGQGEQAAVPQAAQPAPVGPQRLSASLTMPDDSRPYPIPPLARMAAGAGSVPVDTTALPRLGAEPALAARLPLLARVALSALPVPAPDRVRLAVATPGDRDIRPLPRGGGARVLAATSARAAPQVPDVRRPVPRPTGLAAEPASEKAPRRLAGAEIPASEAPTPRLAELRPAPRPAGRAPLSLGTPPAEPAVMAVKAVAALAKTPVAPPARPRDLKPAAPAVAATGPAVPQSLTRRVALRPETVPAARPATLAEDGKPGRPGVLWPWQREARPQRDTAAEPARAEASGRRLASVDNCSATLVRAIPDRPRGALPGSAVIARLDEQSGAARDRLVAAELLSGNLPGFLRELTPVTLSGRDATGRPLAVTVCVMPDYLAVGSDEDFVRVPMGLPAAAQVADRFGFLLPTTRIVDAVFAQAGLRLAPRPMPAGDEMRSTSYFRRHNATVEDQRGAVRVSSRALVAGQKKDLVLTNALRSRPGRVAIYGWHRPGGQPIQPLSTVHGAMYADYSHGVRLVSRTAFVEGRAVALTDVLADPAYAGLLSDEGPIESSERLLASLYR